MKLGGSRFSAEGATPPLLWLRNHLPPLIACPLSLITQACSLHRRYALVVCKEGGGARIGFFGVTWTLSLHKIYILLWGPFTLSNMSRSTSSDGRASL